MNGQDGTSNTVGEEIDAVVDAVVDEAHVEGEIESDPKVRFDLGMKKALHGLFEAATASEEMRHEVEEERNHFADAATVARGIHERLAFLEGVSREYLAIRDILGLGVEFGAGVENRLAEAREMRTRLDSINDVPREKLRRLQEKNERLLHAVEVLLQVKQLPVEKIVDQMQAEISTEQIQKDLSNDKLHPSHVDDLLAKGAISTKQAADLLSTPDEAAFEKVRVIRAMYDQKAFLDRFGKDVFVQREGPEALARLLSWMDEDEAFRAVETRYHSVPSVLAYLGKFGREKFVERFGADGIQKALEANLKEVQVDTQVEKPDEPRKPDDGSS